jgi:Na+-driven multidrug efflux pump
MLSATQASVRSTLRTLIVPMVISLLLVGSTGVVDTFYLSFLGSRALTAFSFMYPIILGAGQLSIGCGIGVTSVLARRLGAGDHAGAARLVMHTFLAAVVGIALLTLCLGLSRHWIFQALGADEAERPLIDAFMQCWLPSIGPIVLIGWGTAVLRAFGETRSTALVMLLQSVLNVLMAPVFMFWFAHSAEQGMRGAGRALLFASIGALLLTAAFLYRQRARLPNALDLSGFLSSIRSTLAVAIPAVLNYLLVPATSALFTTWLAPFGSDAVAAFGVASRFEGFIVMVPLGVGAGIAPFVGLCWGAGHLDELRYGVSWCLRMVRIWGVSVAVIFAVLAVPVGDALADTPELAASIAAALWIAPVGYTGYGAVLIASAVYNNIGQSVTAASFGVLRTVILAIPLGLIGTLTFGFHGLYAALPLASVITERYTTHRLGKDRLRMHKDDSRKLGKVSARDATVSLLTGQRP